MESPPFRYRKGGLCFGVEISLFCGGHAETDGRRAGHGVGRQQVDLHVLEMQGREFGFILVYPQTCSLFSPCFAKCARWDDPGSCLSDYFISCCHLFSLMAGVLRDRQERAKLEHLSSNHYASDYLWQYNVFCTI